MKNPAPKDFSPPDRPARIVTVCAQGRDPKSAAGRDLRLRDIENVATALKDWGPVDAVLFPGGFLFEETAKTAALLNGDPGGSIAARAARKFFARLDGALPGVQLVLGVDTSPYETHGITAGGQQLALAFNRKGLSGFARKIFPVGEDVDGKTMPPFVTHVKDFSDPRRIIPLANGSRALLNVCYDMFGIAAAARNQSGKLRKAAMVEDHSGLLQYKSAGWPALQRSFAAYREMLAGRRPDVALGAIHRFAAPGRESFWQRHGIASASAGLRHFNNAAGGFAVAAAHVAALSPDPLATRLMACGVPAAHLEAGMFRQAHAGVAQAHCLGPAGEQGRPRWIARLYTP